MHTGSYGLMSADGSVQPAGQKAGPAQGGQRVQGQVPGWPVWSGPVPPLADGFTVRPDTVPNLETALIPGSAVALVPDQAPASAQDWRASSGKTQLARHYAESLWRSPGVDVLTWVVASSRASVLSGFVYAATAIGVGDVGDAESVAAWFIDWLSQTTRPWLVVLDDLRDAADLRGLWPSGPTGRLLITTANPAVISAERPGADAAGAGLQLQGGDGLPVRPPQHRPGPAQRGDRPGGRPWLRAARARPGERGDR